MMEGQGGGHGRGSWKEVMGWGAWEGGDAVSHKGKRSERSRRGT